MAAKTLMRKGKKPANLDYYYGKITRDSAEIRLNSHLKKEGTYLLRTDLITSGDFILSIVSKER